MKSAAALVLGLFLALPAFAEEAGFYVNGVSAKTAAGAAAVMQNLIDKESDHDVCYSGDYESALNNVHDSLSIAVNDVYGESEFPALDADLDSADGQSASAIIHSCN